MSSSRVRNKRVPVRLSGLDGALGKATGTVVCLGTDLEHAVEMQGRGLVWKIVVDGDLYGIAFVALNGRNRPLSIDSNHLTRETIGSSL